MDQEKKYLESEIRKEFQLERMILFSDAVFAIVITLMAIEIHLPENGPHSTETLPHQLLHLLPVFVAYAGTFGFIGSIWYEHLKMFSLLKDFDRGLVVRNLLMLFFVGLFPFSVTLVASVKNTTFLPITIYFLVIVFCKGAQLFLQHYILVKRPELRINADITEAVQRFKKSRFVLSMIFLMFFLVVFTSLSITDPELRPIAWWWFMPFPFILKYYERRLKRQKVVVTSE